MIRLTDQYFWNVVFAGFFLLLVSMGAIILDTEARLAWTDLALVDYTLIVLASWRLVQLFGYESLTRFFREQFWDVKKVGRGYELIKPAAGPRRTLADLLSNPWSLGLWWVATVTFCYLLTAWAVFPVIILALSSLATGFHLLVQWLSHSAERAKKQSEML